MNIVSPSWSLESYTRGFPGGPVVRTSPSNAGGAGLKLRSQIPRASQPKSQNIKQKQYCNKMNKDLLNSPHEKKFFKDNHTNLQDHRLSSQNIFFSLSLATFRGLKIMLFSFKIVRVNFLFIFQ